MRDQWIIFVAGHPLQYWVGDVQDSQGLPPSKMSYIVLGGALNSTHSLGLWFLKSYLNTTVAFDGQLTPKLDD